MRFPNYIDWFVCMSILEFKGTTKEAFIGDLVKIVLVDQYLYTQ
jgi:hypothetical protein